jgi:hypothetical protein
MVYENWRVVAVTAEKKVAIVVIVRYLDASCCCAERIKGRPEQSGVIMLWAWFVSVQDSTICCKTAYRKSCSYELVRCGINNQVRVMRGAWIYMFGRLVVLRRGVTDEIQL